MARLEELDEAESSKKRLQVENQDLNRQIEELEAAIANMNKGKISVTTQLEDTKALADAEAKDRWTEVTTTYKKEIQDVIEMTIAATFMYPFRKMVNDVGVDSLLARLPNDWGDEIVSIASILEMSKTDVFLYNLAYALMGFCTSIVAQDEQGNVYHGRNLDFGLWPDVNWTDVQWDLTTDLKKVLFIANFTKGGEVFYCVYV